jgi:photosystem II stability/assembly factor-like uncharacterized protein
MADESWTNVHTGYPFAKILFDETGQRGIAMPNTNDSDHLYLMTYSTYGLFWGSSGSIPDFVVRDFATNSTFSLIIVAGFGTITPEQPLYLSTDGGSSFVALDSPVANWDTIGCDSTGQYIVAGQTGANLIYWSNDSGATWTQSEGIPPTLIFYFLTMSADGSHVFILGGDVTEMYSNTFIFVSTDYGAHFMRIGFITDNVVYAYALSCSATGQYLFSPLGNGGIYRSSDYGVTWIQTSAPTYNIFYFRIACDERGQNVITYDVNVNDTYVSLDHGETWTLQTISGTHNSDTYPPCLAISQNGRLLFSYTNDVGLFRRLPSAGQHEWNVINVGNPVIQTAISDYSGQHLVGLVNYTLNTSADFGLTWSSSGTIIDYAISGFATNASQAFIVVAGFIQQTPTESHLYRSTDNGVTFSSLDGSPLSKWGAVTSDTTGRYLVAGQNDEFGQIYYSHDYGETWFLSQGINSIYWYSMVSSSNGQYIVAAGYLSDNTGVFVSSDYGVHFTFVGTVIEILYKYVNQLSCSASGQYVYATFANDGIYRSSDYGFTWTLTSAKIDNYQYYYSVANDSTGQVVLTMDTNHSETFLSFDYGQTWILQYIPATRLLELGSTFVNVSGNGQVLFSQNGGVGLFQLYPIYPPVPISDTCFIAGTPISCDQGMVPIHEINPFYHTIDNHPIVAITRTRTHDKYLIRFDKDALSDGVPSQPVTMSSKHKVLFQGRMREAQWFVHRISNVHCVPNNSEILYHVLLEEHAIIQVNGLWCETLHPKNTIAKWTTKATFVQSNKKL